jgi:hypothetical protein
MTVKGCIIYSKQSTSERRKGLSDRIKERPLKNNILFGLDRSGRISHIYPIRLVI